MNLHKENKERTRKRRKEEPGGKEKRKENDQNEDLTSLTSVSDELSAEVVEKVNNVPERLFSKTIFKTILF